MSAQDTPGELTLTDTSIGYDLALRPDNRVNWDDLTAVYILTTDRGPIDDDVFVLLQGKPGAGNCLVPQEPASPALDRLMKLPEFDFEAFIRSMSCAENARFLVWQRKA
ncbi:MAG: hypothetical protein AB7P50_05245 [Alphaproteobacteria bacterium]